MLVFIKALLLTSAVFAFPNRSGFCIIDEQAMTNGMAGRNSPQGYSITVDKPAVPGQKITVTVRGRMKGLLLYATSGGNVVGVFDKPSGSFNHLSTCNPQGSTISHSNSDEKTNPSFVFTVPAGLTGALTFNALAVKEFDKWQVIKYDAAGNVVNAAPAPVATKAAPAPGNGQNATVATMPAVTPKNALPVPVNPPSVPPSGKLPYSVPTVKEPCGTKPRKPKNNMPPTKNPSGTQLPKNLMDIIRDVLGGSAPAPAKNASDGSGIKMPYPISANPKPYTLPSNDTGSSSTVLPQSSTVLPSSTVYPLVPTSTVAPTQSASLNPDTPKTVSTTDSYATPVTCQTSAPSSTPAVSSVNPATTSVPTQFYPPATTSVPTQVYPPATPVSTSSPGSGQDGSSDSKPVPSVYPPKNDCEKQLQDAELEAIEKAALA
ncbi:hypothetical protein MP638_000900 [Amoeboaphelidium occidentale]|nr:hypothetical protein MP638_000900 [Amoeboaphelidium occidentale]